MTHKLSLVDIHNFNLKCIFVTCVSGLNDIIINKFMEWNVLLKNYQYA